MAPSCSGFLSGLPRCHHAIARVGLLALLLLSFAFGQAQTAVPDRVILLDSHQALPAVGTAGPNAPRLTRTTLTPAETAAPIEIELVLRMRNFSDLQARVHRGEQVSPQELAAKYQPTAADYQAATAWLTAQGLTITQTDPAHVAVFARGTARELSDAFQVTFARVAAGGTEWTSAITAPSLPTALAGPVLGINGLQPHLHPHKHILPAPQPSSTSTTTAPSYWPRDLLQAYDGDTLTEKGTGQTIGIVIDTFPAESDLNTFWATIGSPQTFANMEFVQVVAGTLPAPSGEETLDVEWASGIASGAKVRVYAASSLAFANLDKCYAQAYTEVSTGTQPTLHQLSMSFGLGEKDVTTSQFNADEQYFVELAAVGVSIFVSVGDDGSNPNDNPSFNQSAINSGPLQVEWPGSSVEVTAVGGTSLVLTTTGSVTSETVWNNSLGATGGGTSIHSARPSWQVGSGMTAGSFRLVPDVALSADPNNGALVILNGSAQEIGGTSWGAPSWAAFCALINQARALTSQGAIGLLGPKIYPLLGTGAFRDITSGNNGAYGANPGYDETSGLGVPSLNNLITALTATPEISTSTPTQTAAPGATVTYTVIGGAPPPFIIQWFRLPVGAPAWVSLTDGPIYSGTSTLTLTVTGVTTAMNGDQFFCTIDNPHGAATSPAAGLLVAEPVLVQTIAGLAGQSGSANGAAASATFNFPNGIAEDLNGNIYLGDMDNDTIRKITPAGVVSTFAGATGSAGNTNSTIGTNARFNAPGGVATDAAGNVYVADYNNNTIRKITPAGAVSLLAGSSTGRSGSTNSNTGTNARFKGPADLAVDASGNVYVADQGNNLIRKITPAGAVTTVAGTTTAGSADGTGTAATFNEPGGIGIDASGNLYIADTYNHTIRKIAMPAATVTTLAGSPGVPGSDDGITGTAARFNYPGDVQPDTLGNLYIIDSNNNTLREILATGQVVTVAGVAGTTGSTDGLGPFALFNGPGSIINEPGGTFVLADTTNNIIRRITQLVVPAVQLSPATLTLGVGSAAVFTATITGAPAPAIQWQRLPAGTTTWVNLTDNATYTGSSTPALSIASVTLAMNGDQFQCVVTNVAGTATSAPATLAVQVPTLFTSAAGDAWVIGQAGSFTVSATGLPTVTYSASGLPAWANLNPTSGVLSGTPPNALGSPYTLLLTAGNGLAANATQSFTLIVQNTFTAWQTANFTPSQLATPAVSGPAAVLGPDSSSNLLKYALGIAPNQSVPANLFTVSLSGTAYTFTYVRPAATTDLTYTVQESPDLQTWSTIGVTQQLLSASASTGLQTWQAQYTTSASAVFFQLLITQP